MGKHDKATADSYLEARIEELEKRLEFANETVNRLQAEIKKYNKWMYEIQERAQDEANALRAEIAKRDEAILRLVVQ